MNKKYKLSYMSLAALTTSLLISKPLNADNVVTQGGTSTGPGSFPYAFSQANNNLSPIVFAPIANGQTCKLQSSLSVARIVDIDLNGLNSGDFTIDGGPLILFPPNGLNYSGTNKAELNFNGKGSLILKRSGFI